MKQKQIINPRLKDIIKRKRKIAVTLAAFQLAAEALAPFEPSVRTTAIRALLALYVP